ncbi:molecular chaperone [Providencia vermicola]|uniref:fimbrial biogenesis chaperone n=1 Tax=Providencia vermicola TaxID=333965 RepID=UPI001CEDFB2C|nr:molecular chaperone [Providencia vermicola]
MKKLIKSLLITLLVSQSTFAAVSLDHSRVIFKQDDKSQSITANNTADKKYIVQSLIFTNADTESVTSKNFTVIPPIVALKEKSNNALKIIPQSLGNLPNDRESLFYVMVNFIPETKQRNSNDNRNHVGTTFNLSTKIVIKMFYRPNGIKGHVNEYIDKLTVTQVNDKVTINNPSPYYYTLVNIKIDGVPYSSDRAPMVAPFSTFDLKTTKKASKIEWSIINDYGGETKTNPITLNGTKNAKK